MKKGLFALLSFQLTSTAFASQVVITPGTYTNSKGCSVVVIGDTDSSAATIEMRDPTGVSGHVKANLDFEMEQAGYFDACEDTEFGNYPVKFERDSSESEDQYTVRCGGALRLFTARMSVVVDSKNRELQSVEYLSKVGIGFRSGVYVPGVQFTQVKINCDDLKLSR